MPTKRSIVKANAETDRVPSGPVQFGDDWPGLFIRGDHALKVATCVRQLQEEVRSTPIADGWALKFLAELAALIENDVDTRRSASA